MAADQRTASTLKVFISYSRGDMSFADQLVAGLEEKGFQCLIDRRDLPYGEQWQSVLRDFMRDADTVVYIVSHRSIKSQWCRWELAEVTKLSKRLVPVVIEAVIPETLPPEISAVHLMPFRPEFDFGSQINALGTVLLTDRVWIQEHTRLSVRALKWDAGARKRDGLLRGSDLSEAESWKMRPTVANLVPDPLVEAFISDSRSEATRSQRLRTRLASAIAVGALALSAVAGWQGWQALQSEARTRTVTDQAQRTESGLLADSANRLTSDTLGGDVGTAILLSLEALPDAGSPDKETRDRKYSDAALGQLDRALRLVREEKVLAGQDKLLSDVAISPSGEYIVTSSNAGALQIWKTSSGEKLFRMEGHDREVLTVEFSKDGKRIVSASKDATARVWDALTGKELKVLRGHSRTVTAATFSYDSLRVLTSSEDNTSRVWDISTGREVVKLDGHTGDVKVATFSADGTRIVTASEDGNARVFDGATGALQFRLQHDGPVNTAVFDSRGTRVLSASVDSHLRLWDMTNGYEIARFKHDAGVNSAEFGGHGAFIVSASTDGTARVWDVAEKKEVQRLSHPTPLKHATFSNDGYRILTRSLESVHIWEPGGSEISRFDGHIEGANGAVLSPDGTRVVTIGFADADSTARVWRVAPSKGNLVSLFPFSADLGVRHAQVVADRIVGVATRPNSVKVWDVSTGEKISEWDGVCGSAKVEFEYSPDVSDACVADRAAVNSGGTRLALAFEDMTARVFDIASGKVVTRLPAQELPMESIALSHDGKYVVTASGSYARVWNGESGVEIARFEGHDRDITSTTFSNDGESVLTSSDDSTARIWDTRTGTELKKLVGHDFSVHSAAYSNDESRIVTASDDDTVRIWDSKTGSEIHRWNGITFGAKGVAFSHDGLRIASNTGSGLRIWTVEGGEEITRIQGIMGTDFVKFSRDGRTIIVGSTSGTIETWQVHTSVDELVQAAKARAPRCLTQHQRKAYFLPLAPPTWCVEQRLWPYHADDWQEWLLMQRAWLASGRQGEAPRLPEEE